MGRFSKILRKPKIRLTKPRLKLPKAPSKTFWYAIILFIVYFCLAGGIYNIVVQPITVGSDATGNPVFIFSSSLGGGIDEQFLMEGLIGSLLMFFGFVGFITLYEGTKHLYTPNYAYTLIIIGAVMIMIGFIGLQSLVALKIS
jgi:hypothetical protein